MANYYNDEIKFQLNHPLMKRIVELKERNYADKDEYDYAPQNYEDALDNYDKVLDLAAEAAAKRNGAQDADVYEVVDEADDK